LSSTDSRTMPPAYNREIAMADWKDTCNLPRTPFSMKANLQTTEPETVARWDAMDLYGKIRGARKGAHCGSLEPNQFGVRDAAGVGGPQRLTQVLAVVEGHDSEPPRGRGAFLKTTYRSDPLTQHRRQLWPPGFACQPPHSLIYLCRAGQTCTHKCAQRPGHQPAG